jgi:hypothetical protein
MAMDAASYARFLRGMMDGRLLLGRLLDADAVCADPGICPGRAMYSPIPDGMGRYYGYVTLRELDRYLLQQARHRRAQQQNGGT